MQLFIPYSPFQAVFEADVVEVFLAEPVPAAAFFGADMEIDQALAGAYRDPGYFTPALLAFPSLHQQGFVTVKAVEIADELIFRYADGGL